MGERDKQCDARHDRRGTHGRAGRRARHVGVGRGDHERARRNRGAAHCEDGHEPGQLDARVRALADPLVERPVRELAADEQHAAVDRHGDGVVANGQRVDRAQQQQRERDGRLAPGRERKRKKKGRCPRPEEPQPALDGVEGRRDAERDGQRERGGRRR